MIKQVVPYENSFVLKNKHLLTIPPINNIEIYNFTQFYCDERLQIKQFVKK